MIPIPCEVQFIASHLGQPIEGVLLLVEFGVRRKNTYRLVIGPTNDDGVAILTKEEICQEAKATIQMAMMDYEPLEATFSGQMGIQVMGREEIERALGAFEKYSTHSSFSSHYESRLQNALKHSYLSKTQDIRVARAK